MNNYEELIEVNAIKIDKQLNEFTKMLEKLGFRCASYHIFPFDTETISVIFGGFDKLERSFTISLEDIQILNDDNLVVKEISVYSWKGDCDNPDRDDFRIELEIKEKRKININNNDLLMELEQIYKDLIKRFSLPLQK